jgi:hypothetical protein
LRIHLAAADAAGNERGQPLSRTTGFPGSGGRDIDATPTDNREIEAPATAADADAGRAYSQLRRHASLHEHSGVLWASDRDLRWKSKGFSSHFLFLCSKSSEMRLQKTSVPAGAGRSPDRSHGAGMWPDRGWRATGLLTFRSFLLTFFLSAFFGLEKSQGRLVVADQQ